MTTIRTDIQKRAQSSVFQYAVFRWESALVIGLTLILFFLVPRPFPWWPRYGWLIMGLAGLAAVIYSSLTDADSNARVMLKLFQEQFDTGKLKDKELRKDIDTALEYQRRIEMQVRQQKRSLIRERLETTANQITDWISSMYALALRLDAYRRDDLLAQQRTTLPPELQQLTEQRKRTTNPSTQAQLDLVIDSKGKQWQALRGTGRPHDRGRAPDGTELDRAGHGLQPDSAGRRAERGKWSRRTPAAGHPRAGGAHGRSGEQHQRSV